jgi:outer membrane lipoprotein-sorting protein
MDSLIPCITRTSVPRHLLSLTAWVLLIWAQQAWGAEPNADVVIADWIRHQTNIQTVTAEFVQTRKLKALTEPLVARGRLWFEMPNRFRWELGQPAQTIIVRDQTQLWMISPRLKRAERYPLDGTIQGPWNDALSLLESGFPRDVASFRKQYQLLSLTHTNGTYELQLQPTSTSARRMITRMGLVLGDTEFHLRANELTLADGSSIRNDFDHLQINPKFDADVFKTSVGADYKISEPWKKKP